MKILLILSLILNLVLIGLLAALQFSKPEQSQSSPEQPALVKHVREMSDILRWGKFAMYHKPENEKLLGSWALEDAMESDRLMHAMGQQPESLPQHLKALETVAKDRMATLMANTETLAELQAAAK